MRTNQLRVFLTVLSIRLNQVIHQPQRYFPQHHLPQHFLPRTRSEAGSLDSCSIGLREMQQHLSVQAELLLLFLLTPLRPSALSPLPSPSILGNLPIALQPITRQSLPPLFLIHATIITPISHKEYPKWHKLHITCHCILVLREYMIYGLTQYMSV